MEFEQALEHALDGQALLFTGAGFSRGALSLRGTPLKSGGELARHLASIAGLPDDTKLEDAAEEFAGRYGEDRLIKELEQEFTVQEVADTHLQVARVPWKRVYTTNYDDVLETAYSRMGRRLRPVTLTEKVRDLPKRDTLCVHFSGYIERLSRSSLWSEMKLTDTSYLTASIAESPWATLFRQDLDLARAVLFVGYSISDLDIRRLLFASERLAEKCFFVMGSRPDPSTARRASRFGSIVELDAQGLALALGAKSSTYSPPERLEPVGHCVQRFEAAQPPETFTDQHVFDLLLRGEVQPRLVWGGLHGGPRYFLERPSMELALARLQEGARALVIYSDLGNGKSLFLEGLKCKALDRGYEVYSVVARTPSLFEELEPLLVSDRKALLTVDSYPGWLDVAEFFSTHAADKWVLVLSARTSAHDVMADRLSEILSVAVLPEIGVDLLTQNELEWLKDFFDEYGLWGPIAAWSPERKVDYLSRVCSSQWHAILLKLLESPHILSRLGLVLEELNAKRDYYEVLVAILALAVLGYTPSTDTLITLCGQRVLDSSFRRNAVIREFVDFATGAVRLRSSVAAEFILKRITDANLTLDVLVRLAKAADNAAGMFPFYFEVLKSLMRFSNLQLFLPEKERLRTVIRYYENVKKLPHCRQNPLFWLQYAIACLVLEDFERAGKYFEAAYSFAKARDLYDAYQIDNHYARFLLMRAIRSGDATTCMTVFRKARKIIFEQIQKERLHYPYRVAAMLGEFYATFRPALSHEDNAEVARAARFISDRIERLPSQRQEQRYVTHCWEAMQGILEDAGSTGRPGA